jgi:uncharacterized membrane protein YtjA (UPF0391 family)
MPASTSGSATVLQRLGIHAYSAAAAAPASLSPANVNWWETVMLHYAVVFFIIALIAAVFGFGGIAAGAVGIAKVLFFVFLILAAVSLIANLARRT